MQRALMEFRYAKQTALMAFLVGIVGLATSYLIIMTSESRVFGWIALTVFGMFTLTILRRLVHAGPVVTISSRGISDTRLKISVIPWSQIDAVLLLPRQDSLLVVSPDTKLASLSSFRSGFFRLPGSSVLALSDSLSIAIRFKGLVPSVEEAWHYIRTNYPSKVHESALPRASRSVPLS